MAAKDVKVATDNLSCPVCYQLFKKPKYLPCHHSYCEQCLEMIKEESMITCPECRKKAIVPPGGVKDFDDNFLINRLVDDLILKRKVEGEAEVKCDECSGEDPVVAFCPDCTLFLCHVCNEYHKRSIKSRSHDIVPLTELRSKKDVAIQPKPKAMMCREHDIELLFYCETCDQLVCMYCTVKDHNGHNHDTVKKMIAKHKQELETITAPVEDMIRDLSDTHDSVEKKRKRISQQGAEENKKIDQHYDSMIQRLMGEKKQKKQQLYDAMSQIEKALTVQLSEVQHVQTDVLKMKKLKDDFKKVSDQEVLSAKKEVIDRMQQITDKYKKVHLSSAQVKIEFTPTLPQLELLCSTDRSDPHEYGARATLAASHSTKTTTTRRASTSVIGVTSTLAASHSRKKTTTWRASTSTTGVTSPSVSGMTLATGSPGKTSKPLAAHTTAVTPTSSTSGLKSTSSTGIRMTPGSPWQTTMPMYTSVATGITSIMPFTSHATAVTPTSLTGLKSPGATGVTPTRGMGTTSAPISAIRAGSAGILASSPKTAGVAGKKRKRCGNCDGCKAPKCGSCKFCQDPAVKKLCIMKKCKLLQ